MRHENIAAASRALSAQVSACASTGGGNEKNATPNAQRPSAPRTPSRPRCAPVGAAFGEAACVARLGCLPARRCVGGNSVARALLRVAWQLARAGCPCMDGGGVGFSIDVHISNMAGVINSERPPYEGEEEDVGVVASWPEAHKALFYQKVDRFCKEFENVTASGLTDKAARVLSMMHEASIKGGKVCIEPGDKLSNPANLSATLIAVRRLQLKKNSDAFLKARAAQIACFRVLHLRVLWADALRRITACCACASIELSGSSGRRPPAVAGACARAFREGPRDAGRCADAPARTGAARGH